MNIEGWRSVGGAEDQDRPPSPGALFPRSLFPVKLRGFIILLATAGAFAGALACGAATGVEVFDEVANDGGGQDATLDSRGEPVTEVGNGHETLAIFDSAGDVGVVDVAINAPSGHEAGDAQIGSRVGLNLDGTL
jgi:hypothetical protein